MKYHYQIGFPPGLKTKLGILKLSYSEHARRAAQSDRYAQAIQLPVTLDTSNALAIEIEYDPSTRDIKVLYRVSYDGEHDLCLAVILGRNFVKTVWLNTKHDRHRTLRREEYANPRAMAA